MSVGLYSLAPHALRARDGRVAGFFRSLLLLLAGGSVVAGCGVPWPSSSRQPYSRDAPSFWNAIALLDLERAAATAPDEEHRRLAVAFERLLSGRMAEAALALRTLADDADHALVRGMARARLASILVYEQRWDELAALAAEGPRHAERTHPERTSFLVWANAMRRAPAPHYPVPAHPVSVPFIRSPTGVPVVTARVNGCPRRLWIDTGASTSLVASSVAAACGTTPLVDDTLQMLTSTGRVSAQPAVIARLDIDDLTFRNVQAAIVSDAEMRLKTESAPGQVVFDRIDGIIGFDLLRRYDVEIDYGRARIILRQPSNRANADFSRRNLFWLGYPVVRLVHETGSPTYFGLDTGADYSFATSNLLLKLPKSYLSRERHRIAGIGSDTTATLLVLHDQEFQVGRTALRFSELPIRDLHWLVVIELDGILGSDVGAVGRMRFDMSSGTFSIGPSSR